MLGENTAALTALWFWAITGKPGNCASTSTHSCNLCIFIIVFETCIGTIRLVRAHLFFYGSSSPRLSGLRNTEEKEGSICSGKTKSISNDRQYERTDRRKGVVHRRSRNEFRRWMPDRDELGRAVNKACGCSIGEAGSDWEKSIREWRVREKDGKWSKSQTRSSPRKSESINHRYVQ